MKVKATLTPKNGGAVVLTIDWNDQQSLCRAMGLIDLCVRLGGSVCINQTED